MGQKNVKIVNLTHVKIAFQVDGGQLTRQLLFFLLVTTGKEKQILNGKKVFSQTLNVFVVCIKVLSTSQVSFFGLKCALIGSILSWKLYASPSGGRKINKLVNNQTSCKEKVLFKSVSVFRLLRNRNGSWLPSLCRRHLRRWCHCRHCRNTRLFRGLLSWKLSTLRTLIYLVSTLLLLKIDLSKRVKHCTVFILKGVTYSTQVLKNHASWLGLLEESRTRPHGRAVSSGDILKNHSFIKEKVANKSIFRYFFAR